MMDKNGTADSVILVDFDLASYGFPALDLACIMFYSSSGCKQMTTNLRLTSNPESSQKYLKDYPDMGFISDDIINSFLEMYLIQSELENRFFSDKNLLKSDPRLVCHWPKYENGSIFISFTSSFVSYTASSCLK